MNRSMNPGRRELPVAPWRRPPARVATRMRCAMAILILAVAVALAAIPAFAGRTGSAKETGPGATGAVAPLPMPTPRHAL